MMAKDLNGLDLIVCLVEDGFFDTAVHQKRNLPAGQRKCQVTEGHDSSARNVQDF
jgi:hypothetical protein